MAEEDTKEKDVAVEAQEEKGGASSAAVASIVESVGKLSVLELVELVKTLEDKFGVSAAAPVMQVAAGGGAAAEAVEEQTEFTVMLASFGEKKIQVIKVVRELTGLGLKEAKDLVDGVPNPVKEAISKAEAEEMQKKLEEVGATVEIK